MTSSEPAPTCRVLSPTLFVLLLTIGRPMVQMYRRSGKTCISSIPVLRLEMSLFLPRPRYSYLLGLESIVGLRAAPVWFNSTSQTMLAPDSIGDLLCISLFTAKIQCIITTYQPLVLKRILGMHGGERSSTSKCAGTSAFAASIHAAPGPIVAILILPSIWLDFRGGRCERRR